MAVKFSDGGKGFLGRAPRPTPEQMQARKRDAAAAKAAQLRKQQTRQKIVLGGALVAMAEAWTRALRKGSCIRTPLVLPFLKPLNFLNEISSLVQVCW